MMTQNPEELEFYRWRLKTQRDLADNELDGREDGREEGRNQGILIGHVQAYQYILGHPQTPH